MTPPRGRRPGRGRPPNKRRQGGRRNPAQAQPAAASPVGPRSRSRAGHQLGGEQVEGRQAVRELLVAGRRRTRDVWLADDAGDAPILGDILELAADAGVRVRRVQSSALTAEARSEAPQGVLAHADPLPEADLDAVVSGPGRRRSPPFLLCLDGITDPQNLGALLRTAEGAGVSGVVVPRHRAAHVTPTVAKAAAGAIEHLPIAVVGGLPAALARLAEAGIWTVGLDAAAPTSLFDLVLGEEAVGLVVGAEGRGLGRLVAQRCDVLASIPLRGALPSLNVASAAAVACFEVVRRRGP